MTEFSMLGLNPGLLAAVERMGISSPTPIQARAIPSVLEGRDLMGLAQTGTGKTLAFGLPLLQRLSGQGRPAPKTVRSLILAPTRELVNQISETLAALAHGGPLKVVTVVGGASLNRQADKLGRGTDVLVATPGRLIDLLDRRALTLQEVQVLILDEADQMLDMGFIHALRQIARHLPQERQTLLFSATMPKDMSEIAETYLTRPVRVQVSPPGKAADKIDQAVHFVAQNDKAKLLEHYLDQHRDELALVFARTKHGAEKLMKLLVSWGFAAGSIHGNKSQGQRERTLAAFRAGELKVLVATDVAARGIDIPLVRHVYNYDLPNVPENYIHRIGRTARAGRDGRAMAFCAPAEMADLRAIEKLTRVAITVEGGTPWPEAVADAARSEARKANGRGRGGQGQGQGRSAKGNSGGKAAGAKSGEKPRQHPAYGAPSGGKPRHRGARGGRKAHQAA
ncbi:MAG: ATP-dependent RNA helicase RhlE [Rhodobacteraceae bacterium HLUCCA12]|nr:MAG: ATP-dependent RNA helicase RhlE [Rhodobacteraceae bacterium HLUCCA12]